MKKETLKELLERLDEQSAQFSSHIAEANRFFDTALKKTEALLVREEKEMHATIQKVKTALKSFNRDNEKGAKNKS